MDTATYKAWCSYLQQPLRATCSPKSVAAFSVHTVQAATAAASQRGQACCNTTIAGQAAALPTATAQQGNRQTQHVRQVSVAMNHTPFHSRPCSAVGAANRAQPAYMQSIHAEHTCRAYMQSIPRNALTHHKMTARSHTTQQVAYHVCLSRQHTKLPAALDTSPLHTKVTATHSRAEHQHPHSYRSTATHPTPPSKPASSAA
jgi:hypothetical protein